MNECPATFAGNDEFELIQMTKLLKKGVLPEPGGYMSQSWRLMELLQFAAQEVAGEERRTMGAMFPLFQMMG